MFVCLFVFSRDIRKTTNSQIFHTASERASKSVDSIRSSSTGLAVRPHCVVLMTLTVPAAALCVCVCPRARAWGMSSSAQLLLLSSSSSSSSSPLHSSCVHVVKGGAAPLTLLTVAYSSERSASSTPPGLPPPLRSSKLHVTPGELKLDSFFFGEILPRFFFPTKLALSRGFKRAA